jgi:hypothetical protein
VGLYNDERQPLALALFIAVNAKYKLTLDKLQLLARLSAVFLTDTASRKQPTGSPSRLRDEGLMVATGAISCNRHPSITVNPSNQYPRSLAMLRNFLVGSLIQVRRVDKMQHVQGTPRIFDAFTPHPLNPKSTRWRECCFQTKNRPTVTPAMLARPLFLLGQGDSAMAVLTSRLFWDKKVRIAILTFATFMALC